MKIYNSLTQKKETFVPLESGKVKMYACGPTVYDDPHIGHIRSAYIFEMVRHYLEYSGQEVFFVRNVTDVDDKIIGKALENSPTDLNEETRRVSEKYLEAYHEELATFGIRPPTREPRATQHIPDMVSLIERLLKNGFAYESVGDVYFDVKRFAEYGKLSGQNKEAMLEGARVEPSDKKKDALDFALWKKAKESEPAWDSPWGRGRPGWHIECSAMSMRYLGESFDIHGGGLDLIFPHHENEIAQSEAATGKPFARVWMHHGLVTRDGRKMSKSIKNYILYRELAVKQGLQADHLKFLFLGTHYRAGLDYTKESLKMSEAVWKKFYFFLEDMRQIEKHYPPKSDRSIEQFTASFKEAMEDDFNTPQALVVMHEMLRYARKTTEASVMLGIRDRLLEFGTVFKLFNTENNIKGIGDDVEKAIHQRKEARQKKDFGAADKIREALLVEKQIELIDLADGRTIARRKV